MMLVVFYIATTILTKELVMAQTDQLQCNAYRFTPPFHPGVSCEDIYNKNPESQQRSGYYWITDGPRQVYCGMTYSGSSCEDIYNNNPATGDKSGYYRINNSTWTFCNMTAISNADGFVPFCAGVGGGWKRIANIDISAGDDCPGEWREDSYSGVRYCRVVSDGTRTCASATFPTNGTSYHRVCGRARGYQKGLVAAFHWGNRESQTIDGYYVDGLSITYGDPRQHLWTYAHGKWDNRTDPGFNCPCATAIGGGPQPLSFVGANYYCESGSIATGNKTGYYFNDPLWDGLNCYRSIDCCNIPTLPWFYRELDETTTSYIEARMCHANKFADGSILMDQLELYIQ